ncbi:uncharacterized protein K02A2.6-like [Actinia tenebrosa]|uniref:Uncharacterized protein K02A2.6-like n=1 Tax=Actinia tenebrosa TaxID=6105 RepID=A0A6P8IDW5_ACTTE|nr:uncharacterized protein K02A2.6-like [Actinia tenebrosa]
MQQSMLKLIHKSHLGMVKCKQRAREVLYWPGMNADIEQTIKNCGKCADFQKSLPSEPLASKAPPDLHFSEVGTDLFEYDHRTYLLSVDYYSKYIEVDLLQNTTSRSVIEALKSQFSRHGIPTVQRSDCDSQYMLAEFSSSNGEAQRAVQTVKHLWKKATDKHLALLDYRTTPLEGLNLSPAQLLIGGRPRNVLPTTSAILRPTPYSSHEVRPYLTIEKAKQKYYHDKSEARELTPLQAGEQVRIAPYPGTKKWTSAVVVEHHTMPRRTDEGGQDEEESTSEENEKEQQPPTRGQAQTPMPSSQSSEQRSSSSIQPGPPRKGVARKWAHTSPAVEKLLELQTD